jgi:hypothetical protein
MIDINRIEAMSDDELRLVSKEDRHEYMVYHLRRMIIQSNLPLTRIKVLLEEFDEPESVYPPVDDEFFIRQVRGWKQSKKEMH